MQTAINNEATARSDADAALQQQIDDLTLSVLQRAWPIGSVYENRFDARNPSHQDLLGFGTWVTLGEGRITVGYQSGDPDFSTIGQTGGKKGHKMTLDNLIEHDHDYTDRTELDYAANNSVGLGTDHKDRVLKTSKAGSADPEPIPTMPPYIVVIRWVRTA